jgi:hypothetical protein
MKPTHLLPRLNCHSTRLAGAVPGRAVGVVAGAAKSEAPRARPVLLQSSYYENDGEEEDGELELGGGGWGRRDRRPEPDPALHIEQIEYGWVSLICWCFCLVGASKFECFRITHRYRPYIILPPFVLLIFLEKYHIFYYDLFYY